MFVNLDPALYRALYGVTCYHRITTPSVGENKNRKEETIIKKIIVLTGSFNPVTRAHYEILTDAVSVLGADEGLFVITSDRYLTKKTLTSMNPPTGFRLSEEQRKEMIDSLRADDPKLSCWGVELGGADSNTGGTLRKIYKEKKKQYPEEEIRMYYLCGADKLREIPRWKDPGEIVSICELLVYARALDLESVIEKDPFLTAHRDRIHFMKVEHDELEDISSTEVRKRFFAGEDYRSLMNEGPYELLKKMSPSDFSEPTREEIIRAYIEYGGRFGKGTARMLVYKDNRDMFKTWDESVLGDRKEHQKAIVYRAPFTVDVPVQSQPAETDCVNADCADVAEGLTREGYHPAILNLASRISPCGGYHKGTSAQEESLSQMSTLSQSLYQFGDPKYKHIRESGTVHVPGVYPLDLKFGGIYSPTVTFFRHNEGKYYRLRETTFDCPIITVASLSNRERNEYTNDERKYFLENGYLTDEGKEIEQNKIRTIYRIALANGHDSVVLGAFGCGVYQLKCDEVAALFSSVLEEPEFQNRFKKVVFAIFEGRPTARKPLKGPDGKFRAFYELFAKKEKEKN